MDPAEIYTVRLDCFHLVVSIVLWPIIRSWRDVEGVCESSYLVGIAGLYTQSVDVARRLDAYAQQGAAVGKRCEHIRVAMRVDEDDFDPEGAHLQVAPAQVAPGAKFATAYPKPYAERS